MRDISAKGVGIRFDRESHTAESFVIERPRSGGTTFGVRRILAACVSPPGGNFNIDARFLTPWREEDGTPPKPAKAVAAPA